LRLWCNMELRPCNSQLVDHVVSIWTKQASSSLPENDPVRWSCPTYPYQIKAVDQVFPNRDHLEDFESRRNELDQRLSKGKVKLETLHGFYCPSSEDTLRLILKEGFHNAIVGELTFCADPLQAIRESLSSRPANKLILARVSLGWKDYDYTEINNKYRIKNLRGVLPSFVLTIEPVAHAKHQDAPATTVQYESAPVKLPESQPQSPPTSPYTSTAVRLPKYITNLEKEEEQGIPCASCGRVAGPGSSGRYCVQCGTKIP